MDQIVYFDRYRNETCVEKVYGDRALRWTYGTLAGRMSLNVLVKRALFSRWYGWRMNQPSSREKIAPFIREYDLDVSDFLSNVDDFENFNEFFFRQLRPEARPIDPNPESSCFLPTGDICACRIFPCAMACWSRVKCST